MRGIIAIPCPIFLRSASDARQRGAQLFARVLPEPAHQDADCALDVLGNEQFSRQNATNRLRYFDRHPCPLNPLSIASEVATAGAPDAASRDGKARGALPR